MWENFLWRLPCTPVLGTSSDYARSDAVRMLQNPAMLEVSLKVGCGHRQCRELWEQTDPRVPPPISPVCPETFQKKKAASGQPRGACIVPGTSWEPACKCGKPNSKRPRGPADGRTQGWQALSSRLGLCLSIVLLSPRSLCFCFAFLHVGFTVLPCEHVTAPGAPSFHSLQLGTQQKESSDLLRCPTKVPELCPTGLA